MQAYLELLNHVLLHGTPKNDRTKVGTISTFGYQTRYDLTQGFPLLTTKKMNFKSILHELLWFIKGDTNIKYLVDHDVNIWNAWPYEHYKNSTAYQNETMDEFIYKIKTDEQFGKTWGNLGPIYGKLWRNFHGIDQLLQLIAQIQSNKDSRRLIISAWDPSLINQSLLPPCHCFMQFYINHDQLSCQLYQRSADLFLGVPFNIASYALLVNILCTICHLNPGEFIHTLGDAHIYVNHLEQVNTQLRRKPYPLPMLNIKRKLSHIADYTFDDFELIGYTCHPLITGQVAV